MSTSALTSPRRAGPWRPGDPSPPPADPPVTAADLAVIRAAFRRSDTHTEYVGVYRARDKHSRPFYAKAFKTRVGGCHATARGAAEGLVRWWRDTFGHEWPRVFARRHNTPAWPVHVKQTGKYPLSVFGPDGRAVEAAEGYRLVVCVRGKWEPVYPDGRCGVLFASKAAARAYYRVWRREQFGLFPRTELRVFAGLPGSPA